MIIQEMDLDIRYRSGKSNCSADTLSRNPVLDAVSCVVAETTELGFQQCGDPEFKSFIDYLEMGSLPADDADTRNVVIRSEAFDLTDRIGYHESPNSPGRWCLVVPKVRREALIKEAHDGRFSGHFAEKWIYELLRRRNWWPKMRAEVRHYCRFGLCNKEGSYSCATRPPLPPIPFLYLCL